MPPQHIEASGGEHQPKRRDCAGGHNATMNCRPINLLYAGRLSVIYQTLHKGRRESDKPIGLKLKARNGFPVRFTSTEKEWDDGQVRRWLVHCGNDPGRCCRLQVGRGWLLVRRMPGTVAEHLRRPERLANLHSPGHRAGLRSPGYFTRLHSNDRRRSCHRRVRLALSGPAGLLPPSAGFHQGGRFNGHRVLPDRRCS